VRLLSHVPNRAALKARENRRELSRSGLSRRELFRMGVLTGAGYLVTQQGLSAWATQPASSELGDLGLASPSLTPFVQPLPIMPVLPERPISELGPPPTIDPNRALNPVTGLPFEGRTEPHQFRDQYPAEKFFATRMGVTTGFRPHPDLPEQACWGFNLGGADLNADPPMSPGPTVVNRYGPPVVVRRYNQLPPQSENGGFGVPEVSTHVHNFHSGPESDGSPCHPVHQRFFSRGQYYDYFYAMQYAGFDSTHPPAGDIRETLGTMWYHDHRVDHTSENVYKGLAGFHILFNEFDTGDEQTGLRLPSFPEFDIPMILHDKVFDSETGLLAFDAFALDGLVGDTFLVNGAVQPFQEVSKRRYRFRILDGGPSRFYELSLTNPDAPAQQIPFWVISSDGNLLPRPVEVTRIRLSVAERVDVIVDFAKIAERFGNPARLWLENRLEQTNGRQPTGRIFAAGQGNPLVEFRPVGSVVDDPSFDPEPVSSPRVRAAEGDAVFAPIALPDLTGLTPRLTRTFRFDRGNGQWQVNGQFMDCTRFRFTAERNAPERWIFQNNSNGWQHPIHLHTEEFRIIRRNRRRISPGDVEYGRKDVVRLGGNEQIEVIVRFRDFRGGYPLHCHNTVHEDHQMMLIFDVQDQGDTITRP
jgi:FtsP/CotA-like multicopper oxidase with cupredoxin domain